MKLSAVLACVCFLGPLASTLGDETPPTAPAKRRVEEAPVRNCCSLPSRQIVLRTGASVFLNEKKQLAGKLLLGYHLEKGRVTEEFADEGMAVPFKLSWPVIAGPVITTDPGPRMEIVQFVPIPPGGDRFGIEEQFIFRFRVTGLEPRDDNRERSAHFVFEIDEHGCLSISLLERSDDKGKVDLTFDRD